MMSAGAIRGIAARMPRRFKELRAKFMFECWCETLGVEEVRCPACRGTCWADMSRLVRCPICCGFGEVPDCLADWFLSQSSRHRHGDADSGCGDSGARIPAAARPAVRRPELGPRRGERLGRLAEVTYRVHLPVLTGDPSPT